MADDLDFIPDIDLELAVDEIHGTAPHPADLTPEQTTEYRKRHPTSAVDSHPQRREIIKALLAGDPPSRIAKRLDPPLTRWSISRYNVLFVRPALLRAAEAKAKANSLSLSALDPNRLSLERVAKFTLGAVAPLRDRDNRIRRIQDRADRLDLIVSERAEDMADEVPGGASGLLTRDIKSGGAMVYKVDRSLISAIRETEKDVATELGQLQDRSPVSIMIVVPGERSSAGLQPVQVVDIGQKR